jgi:hypothetical protein
MRNRLLGGACLTLAVEEAKGKGRPDRFALPQRGWGRAGGIERMPTAGSRALDRACLAGDQRPDPGAPAMGEPSRR